MVRSKTKTDVRSERKLRVRSIAKTMIILLIGIVITSLGLVVTFFVNWIGILITIIGVLIILTEIIVPKTEKIDIHDRFLEVSAFIFGLMAISIAIYVSFFTMSQWEAEFGVQSAIAIFLLIFYIFGAALVYEAIKKLRSDREMKKGR
jgi:hypothetical protein